MSFSESPRQKVEAEPGLPLFKLEHCKLGTICWFSRLDTNMKWHRDLGVVVDIDKADGHVIVQSLTNYVGCTEYYLNGKYAPRPNQPYGFPIKTNLDSVKAHLKELRDQGEIFQIKYLAPEARKVVKRVQTYR